MGVAGQVLATKMGNLRKRMVFARQLCHHPPPQHRAFSDVPGYFERCKAGDAWGGGLTLLDIDTRGLSLR